MVETKRLVGRKRLAAALSRSIPGCYTTPELSFSIAIVKEGGTAIPFHLLLMQFAAIGAHLPCEGFVRRKGNLCDPEQYAKAWSAR